MRRRGQGGFSLVSTLIGSSLGVVVIGAAGSVYLDGSASYRQDESRASVQEEISFALSHLAGELEMAGFWGEVHDSLRVSEDGSLRLALDCGPGSAAWAYADRTALAVVNNAGLAGSSAHASHDCLADRDVRAGTDVLAIKRVIARPVADAALAAGRAYLRTDGIAGTLFLGGGSAAPASAHRNWEYRPSVYYVRAWSERADETPQVPALCRRYLDDRSGTPSFAGDEVIARGIENLQVEIGVDADEDGAANYFVSAPTAAELTQATAVRLYLLARSARREAQYHDAKQYEPGGDAATYVPAGDDIHYQRRALATDVLLRNPRALHGVAIR